MMDSTEQHQTQLSGSNHITDSSGLKQSHSDYKYTDDFEELDALNQEMSNHSSESGSKMTSKSKSYLKKDGFHKGDNQSDTDSTVEKGQRESSGQIPMEKDRVKEKPNSIPAYDELQSDDSEPEPEGEVLFTEDQHRAMMELMTQKHSSGNYTGDPPEYNVKQRLKELNEELAKEPDPDDRQHRVGFKKELVDLVAPAPEVSDDDNDDDSPRKLLHNEDKAADEESKEVKNKKQFVVERDGKFDIVGDQELSVEERAMFNILDVDTNTLAHNSKKQSGVSRDHQTKSSGCGDFTTHKDMRPQPPSKPRPNTANGYSRRSAHGMQSPRPRTASSGRSASNSSHGALLQDFNYTSPYAMSSSEKERAQERARLREQQRKEEERYRQEEEEYRRQESEEAFQAWLQQKMEEDKRRRQEEEDKRRRSGKDDTMDSAEPREQGNSALKFPSSEPFELLFPLEAKESEEAFRGWLKQKQAQLKREKLLKRREEQGLQDTYYVRSREECDTAYKEWLKKKYVEFRKQRVAEKERQRSFMFMARRARRQQMMARAVRQSPAFTYIDVYGYRI